VHETQDVPFTLGQVSDFGGRLILVTARSDLGDQAPGDRGTAVASLVRRAAVPLRAPFMSTTGDPSELVRWTGGCCRGGGCYSGATGASDGTSKCVKAKRAIA
jgi:hypothetical protein